MPTIHGVKLHGGATPPRACHSSAMKSLTRRQVVALMIGLVLVGVGGFRLATLHSDVDTSSVVLRDGTPVVTYALPGLEPARADAVVILHGYTASGVIIRSLAASLARAGFVVAVPDFAGHGRNVAAAAPIESRVGQWRDQMLVVIENLAADPRVDSSRGVGLVGHSLGALAAFDVVNASPQLPVRAIVAVSPPSIDALDATVPTSFLYGAGELRDFVDAAAAGETALRDRGTPTQLVRVGGVEHVGIILSPVTAQTAATWLRASGSESAVTVTPPLVPLALVILGLMVMAAPAARLALGSRVRPSRGPHVRQVVAFTVIALGVGAGAAWLSRPLHSSFPLEVGGYLVTLFTTSGLVLWLSVRWWRRRTPEGDGQGSDSSVVRTTVGTLALTAFFIAALALSAQESWSAFHLGGPRRWALPAMEIALLIFFIAESMLVRRSSARLQAALMVMVRVLVVATMYAGVALLDAPRILVIQIPLIAILLALTGWWGYVVSRHTVEPWAAATVQAIPIAYVAASALPLL
jgi:dienelactone hydrolase